VSDATYTLILCGTDGSESSFRAVDRAAAVARDAGATLLLACAYRPMSAREVQDAADALGGESYKVSGATPAEDVLRDAADRAKRLGAKDVEILRWRATRSTSSAGWPRTARSTWWWSATGA
jgi:nucleotide-binding universal stress UspA family protein